jgi:hypothetical protein
MTIQMMIAIHDGQHDLSKPASINLRLETKGKSNDLGVFLEFIVRASASNDETTIGHTHRVVR